MKKLLFLTVLALASSVFPQEKTKIDEFGKITCEDLLARIDSFHIQLQNNPASHGIVVIDSPQTGLDRSPWYRLFIQKTFQRHGYEYERLQFYRRRTSEIGGSLWLTQPGTEVPVPDVEPWPDAPIDLSRPFKWDTYEDDGVCPTFAPREYARLLKTNPGLRGHIVIHAATRRAAIATGVDWVKEMTERWGVPRNRLRLIIGKPNRLWFSTDFWLVPTRKK